MPNHCMNQVTLNCSSKEEALVLKKQLAGKEGAFDFNTLAPEPPELLKSRLKIVSAEELRKLFGHDNWYDWRIENWGTKWNSYECELDNSQVDLGVLDYRFDTAWGPPEPIYRALQTYIADHSLKIDVSWFYNEPGMELAGYLEGE